MIPFEKSYYIQKIKDYENKIKEKKLNKYSILKTNIKNPKKYLYKDLNDSKVSIIELRENENIMISISPYEIQGSFEAIKWAYGKVGIVGLGLGYVVQEILKKDDVEEVVVYEISEDIINLYRENFSKNNKLRIIKGDAFKAKRESFNCFYSDIYQYKLTKNVVEDYIKFNKIHSIDEYSFWGMEHFLLSCAIEDLLMIYIPENWIHMAQDLFNRLSDHNKIDDFVRLDENEVRDILLMFKKVLNNE